VPVERIEYRDTEHFRLYRDFFKRINNAEPPDILS
jgi:hypothetical protein